MENEEKQSLVGLTHDKMHKHSCRTMCGLTCLFLEGKTPVESEENGKGEVDEKSEVNLNDHPTNSEDEDMAVLAQLGSTTNSNDESSKKFDCFMHDCIFFVSKRSSFFDNCCKILLTRRKRDRKKIAKREGAKKIEAASRASGRSEPFVRSGQEVTRPKVGKKFTRLQSQR